MVTCLCNRMKLTADMADSAQRIKMLIIKVISLILGVPIEE